MDIIVIGEPKAVTIRKFWRRLIVRKVIVIIVIFATAPWEPPGLFCGPLRLCLTDSRSNPSHRSRSWYVSGHGSRLGRGGCLSCSRLLLHLSVALTEVEHLTGQDSHQTVHVPKNTAVNGPDLCGAFGDACGYLDVSAGVDFVNSISGRSTRLPVQVVALNKHGVVTQAAHPHVALALTLQLHAFADVKPGRGERGRRGRDEPLYCGHYDSFNITACWELTFLSVYPIFEVSYPPRSLDGLGAMHVAQLA